AVDLVAHDGVGGDLDVVHPPALEVLDVPAADVRELVGRGSDAERVHAELEHAQRLRGAVLAAAAWDDAVVVRAAIRAVAVQDGDQVPAPGVPVNFLAALVTPAGAADALPVDKQVRLRRRHHATFAISQH